MHYFEILSTDVHEEPKDFELSVNTKSEQYLLDAWSENQELFGAILENKELRKQIFSVFINDIYNKFRNE